MGDEGGQKSVGIQCRQTGRTSESQKWAGGCGKAYGSGSLGHYKAVETDAHSCRAVSEMCTTQTHSSPPDTPWPGFHSADSINTHRNVFKPSRRKRATVPVYTRLSWMGFRG